MMEFSDQLMPERLGRCGFNRSLDFQAMLRIGDHSLGPCLWTCDVCPQPQYLHQIHETTAAELLIRGAPLATLSCPPPLGNFTSALWGIGIDTRGMASAAARVHPSDDFGQAVGQRR